MSQDRLQHTSFSQSFRDHQLRHIDLVLQQVGDRLFDITDMSENITPRHTLRLL
jgi:hypothetical protein